MVNKFFLHQIKCSAGNFDKGIVVKNLERQDGETDEELSKRNYEAAQQGYHAYLGAYAYGQHADTNFVQVEITDYFGTRLMAETWIKPEG